MAFRIASYVYGPNEELLYEFSVWKDDASFVCERFLSLLAQAVEGACPRRLCPQRMCPSYSGCDCRWGKVYLRSTYVTLDVSGAVAQPGFCVDYNMSPSAPYDSEARCLYSKDKRVRDRHTVCFLLWRFRQMHYGHPTLHEPWVDTAKFCEFTHELLAAHAGCEPDAFGVCRGGQGSSVKIWRAVDASGRRRNTSKGTLVEPVDLVSCLWVVCLGFGRTIKVSREHIRRDSRRWIDDRMINLSGSGSDVSESTERALSPFSMESVDS